MVSAPLPTLVIGWSLEDGLVPLLIGFPGLEPGFSGFEPPEGAAGDSAGGTPTLVVGGFTVAVGGFTVGEGPGDGSAPAGLEPGGAATGGLTGTSALVGAPTGIPAAAHWVRGGELTLHRPGRANTCVGLMEIPKGLLVPNN